MNARAEILSNGEPLCPDCGGPMLDGIHLSPFAACLYDDDEHSR
jgi:hypothetical protein